MALTGTYFWVKSFSEQQDSVYEDYRETKVTDGENTCKFADTDKKNPDAAKVRDICDTNARNKWLARILVPTGAVIAGVGAYLLLTSGDEKPTSAKAKSRRTTRVEPFVGFGPEGGEVRVNVTF